MPRLPRYVLPGYPYHIIQRGINRCPIFVADKDYTCFLHILYEACQRHGCLVHAYVLMTNHVHLAMTPQKENSLAKVLQSVGRRYVQHFNISYQRTGTLWGGRYKAAVIDADLYLLACYRYIELNPVRTNMVAHPGDYRWSSYAANALGESDPLVTPHLLYQALGTCAGERQAEYRRTFQDHIDNKTLAAVRDSTQKGWALGDDRFKDKIEQLLHRRVRPLPRGGDRRSIAFRESKARL